MIQGKVWGTTQRIFHNDNFEVHRITVKKKHKCSKHKHQFKHNIFYIERGRLMLHVWKNDYDLCDKTELVDGETTDVPPNEWHMFEAVEDTVAYEIYYSEPISKDIIRETCGGKVGM